MGTASLLVRTSRSAEGKKKKSVKYPAPAVITSLRTSAGAGMGHQSAGAGKGLVSRLLGASFAQKLQKKKSWHLLTILVSDPLLKQGEV